MFEHTMCSGNLQGTQVKETGRQLQASDLSPFSNKGLMFASVHSLGISPESIDCWNRCAKMGPYSVAIFLRTLG